MGVYYVLFVRIKVHIESEILIWNFHTLKNKYDLMLCQSHLHTASETFVHHKTFGIRFDFLCFCICSKHFDRKVWQIQKKLHRKISNSVCKDLKSASVPFATVVTSCCWVCLHQTCQSVFWRMLITKQLLIAIDFHSIFFHIMDAYGYCQLFGYQHFSKYLLL